MCQNRPTEVPGILRYRPIPEGVKSERAYLGDALVVEPADGSPVVIRAGAAVSEAELQALDGRQVEVRGALHPASAPDPHESYPTLPDRSPVPRPAWLEVTAYSPIGD